MKGKFLRREVKKYRIGLYVHLGSYRLRPTTKNTLFQEGNLVSIVHQYGREINPITMNVFSNIKAYEIWKSKLQG